MDETVNMSDFKKEAFKRKVKDGFDWCKKKVDEGIAWAMEHPGEAIALATLTAGTIKKGSGSVQTVAENRRRDLDLYDPRTGSHSKMRRRPSPTEQVMIDRRYNMGESYKEILYDMGLLR